VVFAQKLSSYCFRTIRGIHQVYPAKQTFIEAS
jgi:hypothetical protein